MPYIVIFGQFVIYIVGSPRQRLLNKHFNKWCFSWRPYTIQLNFVIVLTWRSQKFIRYLLIFSIMGLHFHTSKLLPSSFVTELDYIRYLFSTLSLVLSLKMRRQPEEKFSMHALMLIACQAIPKKFIERSIFCKFGIWYWFYVNHILL